MYGLAPTGWRKGKLRYEIQIANGKFVSDKISDDGEFPIYGGNGVMARSDEWNTKPPFIVIGRVGAYCGNAHYVDEKAWVSDNAMHVTTNHYPQFLAEVFTTLDFNSQANNTAQPVINGTKIKNTHVLLPSRMEQIKIHGFISEQRKKFSMLTENLSSQIATLTAYRKSLIHECVTGKRRISDADVAKILSTTDGHR